MSMAPAGFIRGLPSKGHSVSMSMLACFWAKWRERPMGLAAKLCVTFFRVAAQYISTECEILK
jgi:hypothetical protein